MTTVTQPQHTRPPYLRPWATVGLGVASIAVSGLLITTDGITGTSRWAHHRAISAGTIVWPRQQRRLLMPAIAALAFTARGLAQLLSNSAAAGYLSDTAILLFVTDATYAITVNARTPQPPNHGLFDGQAAVGWLSKHPSPETAHRDQ